MRSAFGAARARRAPWCARRAACSALLVSAWVSLGAPSARADDPVLPAPIVVAPRSTPPSSAPAGRTAATPAPREPVPRDGPLVLRLALENDNLLFGTYGRMAGHDQDGNDLGRTHATSIGLSYDLDDRLAIELDASTQLYTHSITGLLPGRMLTVPIYFHELSNFRLGIALMRPDAPWRARFGMGAEVSNRDSLATIGAVGQQSWWHRFCRYDLDTGTWLFEYHQDGGGIHVGATTDLSVGAATRVLIASWLWLELDGDAGGRAGTLRSASWLEVQGRIALGVGELHGARAVLALRQEAFFWLEHPGAMLRSTIDLRLDVSAFALELALHRYEGDQNEAYYVYVFGNTTMTFGLWTRI